MKKLILRALIAGLAGWTTLPLVGARQWQYADTGNFEVITNARTAEAQKMIGELEQFREHFLMVFPNAKCREPRVTVVIFDSDKEFRPYKPLYKGKPADVAGVFQGFPDEVTIALSAEGDVRYTIPVIFHEYVHMLMHARGYRLPPWLSEGMAELYSTMHVEGGRLKIGSHIPHHLMLLNQNRLMPLAQLFSVSQSSPDYNEGTRRGLFYAQSWALLHYWDCGLATETDQVLKKRRFLELLQSGLPAERCMQEAFGKSLARMEADLASYVRGGGYYVRTVAVEKVNYGERVKFRPATDLERDVGLANLKWRLQRNGDANYHMLQFAESAPESSRPLELLAAMNMVDGEYKRAVEYWRQAADRKSTNAYVYEQLARDTLWQYLNGVSLSFRFPDEVVAELRGWLDQALAREPDYAEAWEWLALTEAFAPKMRTAIVNKAVARQELLSSRPRFLAAIAVIALRVSKDEMAGRLAEELLQRPDVQRQQDRKGNFGGGGTGPKRAGLGSSWMAEQEYYPDVLFLARAIKRHLDRKKLPESSPTPAPELVE